MKQLENTVFIILQNRILSIKHFEDIFSEIQLWRIEQKLQHNQGLVDNTCNPSPQEKLTRQLWYLRKRRSYNWVTSVFYTFLYFQSRTAFCDTFLEIELLWNHNICKKTGVLGKYNIYRGDLISESKPAHSPSCRSHPIGWIHVDIWKHWYVWCSKTVITGTKTRSYLVMGKNGM